MIAEDHLSTLVDMVEISRSSVCDGDGVTNAEFRQSVSDTAESIYQQAHALGGGDAVWKNPQDGSCHHPTFPEQQGKAWEALQEHRSECLEMEVVGLAADILAERNASSADEILSRHEYYEHRLLDILEDQGIRGLMKALIGWPAGLQENS